MKPASRIAATLEILESPQRARVPLDKCVGDYMRNRRYIGSKDRSAVAERVYHMTRNVAKIGWWLDHVKTEDTPRNRLIAWLILGEEANEKRIKDLFDGSQYAPEVLTDEEHAFASKLFDQKLVRKDMNEAVIHECPTEHEEKLREMFGDDFAAEMEAMLQPATLDLRVNIFTADKEKVIGSLAKDGVSVVDGRFCPWTLKCIEKSYLAKTKALTKGWIDIQDEGSQAIAWLCAAKPGMNVLDFCAGGGGKTLALAAAMQKKGRIVAMDNNERRLENGRKRYKKAGIADIVELRSLSEERHKKWLKRQRQTFDIVLVDAPCSGSGTWRRNPDTRWQHYGPSIEELITLQSEILEKAMRCVKPNGKLVYATCSLFREENEEQVEKFLAAHPEFEIEPVDATLGLGSPFMRLTPYRHATDGFFTAILKRKADVAELDKAEA